MTAAGAGAVAWAQEGIVGIDGRTGRRLWTRPTTRVVMLRAVADGRTVLAWVGGAYTDQSVWALDAFTGRPRWQQDLLPVARELTVAESTLVMSVPEANGDHDPATTPRALAADTVFAQLVCADPAGGLDADLLALDAGSGAELWRRRVSDDHPRFRPAWPLGGGVVAVSAGDDDTAPSTTAVDERTGQDVGRGRPPRRRAGAEMAVRRRRHRLPDVGRPGR
jgi:outer membrane protein assembly factor BamB